MIEIEIEGRKNHLVVRNTTASPSPRDLGDTKGCRFGEYSGQVCLPHAFILAWATATDDCWRWNTDLNEFLVHALHWVCLVPPCLHCSIMCYIIIIMIKHDSVLCAGLSSLCLFLPIVSQFHLSMKFRKQEQKTLLQQSQGGRRGKKWHYLPQSMNTWNDNNPAKKCSTLLSFAQQQELLRSLSCLLLRGHSPLNPKSHINLWVQALKALALKIWIYLLGSSVCYINVLGQILFWH